MEQLAAYFLSITPAFLVSVALLLMLSPELKLVRIFIYILFFVLARDAMTPAGFWLVTADSLRLTAAPGVLLALALASASMVLGTCWLERHNGDGIHWIGGQLWVSLLCGVAGVFAIALAVLILKAAVPVAALPAPATHLIPVILVFALLGNLYEELLFRGLLQAYLARHLTPVRSAFASGLLFCLCHSFLAVGVTQVGAPILVFTLIEGIVAGLVYLRAGVMGSALAHGGAIFLLAAGFV